MTEKNRDFWEESGEIFVTGGKRYGLTGGCRTVQLPDKTTEALQDGGQWLINPGGDTLDTLTKLSVTKTGNRVQVKRPDCHKEDVKVWLLL